MSPVPLRLGPLIAQGCTVTRSAIRWLCEDGHQCRAGEVIGFCSVAFLSAGRPESQAPFIDEGRNVQVALVTRVAGRLRQSPEGQAGGALDLLEEFRTWMPETVIGEITPGSETPPTDAEPLRMIMLTARRPGEFSGSRLGLLSGWTDRVRASCIEGPGAVSTLLSLGICDLEGVLRGERFDFSEILDQVGGPAHIVYTPDDALVHTAGVVREQAQRTEADCAAISRDLAETLAAGPVVPTPRDWIFAGAFLSALTQSPINDRYEVLARDGLRPVEPADAILMSVGGEGLTLMRHKRLGYTVHMHRHRAQRTGPAFRRWLPTHFEPVRRSIDMIKADYAALVDAVRARRPDTRILVCNVMSTAPDEDIQSYAGFEDPVGETVSTVRDKEKNLMLTELEREKGIAVVDIDAIAGEMGGRRHVPDGVHQSGPMQAEVRAEILRLLRAGGVAGFGPRVS